MRLDAFTYACQILEAVRHPGLKLKIPAQVFCVSWCPDSAFWGTQAVEMRDSHSLTEWEFPGTGEQDPSMLLLVKPGKPAAAAPQQAPQPQQAPAPAPVRAERRASFHCL